MAGMNKPLKRVSAAGKGDNRSVNPQRLKSLLKELIDIYSPNGKEQEISVFLYDYLKEQGLPVIRQPVEDDRENILVIPENNDCSLALLGHVDTITAPDFENYRYRQKRRDKDRIYGLGAADMKGGCAAMIEAYISQWHKGPRPFPAALALVVGEEEDSDGAEKFLGQYRFPYAIVGEPTDLHPCFSHYGYIEANISTRGKRMHASLASSAVNAIEVMLQLLLKIIDYLRANREEVVYNLRDLASSQSGFVVPEYCEAWIDFHLPPHAAIGDVIYELEELFSAESKKKPGTDASLEFTYIHAGYELPEKGELYESLKAIYKSCSLDFEPQSFRSHSDANLLWEAGVRPILLGPGQLEHAHMPDESVSFRQVLTAAEIYSQVIRSL